MEGLRSNGAPGNTPQCWCDNVIFLHVSSNLTHVRNVHDVHSNHAQTLSGCMVRSPEVSSMEMHPMLMIPQDAKEAVGGA
jgi:hypothetical protein